MCILCLCYQSARFSVINEKALHVPVKLVKALQGQALTLMTYFALNVLLWLYIHDVPPCIYVLL